MNSKRIRKLKKEIIHTLPKFPNDRQTKSELESKDLTDLLLIYLNWAARLITPRPRRVIIENDVVNNDRWKALSTEFHSLKNEIEKGNDLTPYLSLKVQKKGYTPATSETVSNTDKWVDKDFLLNVMGFYHLHLGEKIEGRRISGRTDDVIFAKVDKERFIVIGVFNHSVFDKTDEVTQKMSKERQRIWEIFERHSMQGIPEGSIVISSPIMMSGHTMHIVEMAQEYVRIITELEQKLDDREYTNTIYKESNISPPNKPKFEWSLRGTDLGVYDKTTNLYAVYRYGVN